MKKIPCPKCGGAAPQTATNTHLPFCSERCQLLDLASWLDGDYRIPSEPVPPDAHVQEDDEA